MTGSKEPPRVFIKMDNLSVGYYQGRSREQSADPMLALPSFLPSQKHVSVSWCSMTQLIQLFISLLF